MLSIKLKYYSFWIVGILLMMSGCRTSVSTSIIEEDKTNKNEIDKFEEYVEDNPGEFNWKVHNELRHLYAGSNPYKSMEHINIILANSSMDSYMLKMLSEWELEKNPEKAIINLRSKTIEYANLQFIEAASLITIGDIYASRGDMKEAKSHYLQVKNNPSPELSGYRAVAEARLQDAQAKKNKRPKKSNQSKRK